jgi:hypothetical protein
MVRMAPELDAWLKQRSAETGLPVNSEIILASRAKVEAEAAGRSEDIMGGGDVSVHPEIEALAAKLRASRRPG